MIKIMISNVFAFGISPTLMQMIEQVEFKNKSLNMRFENKIKN